MVENKVKVRRQMLGMTLEQIAKESGVPVSTLSEIERGREPGIKAAQKIAKALLTTTDELWPD